MYEYRAKVRSVHDGDTIRCDVDLGFGVWINDQAFRLNRINAPELRADNPAGRTSRLYLVGVIPPGTEVTIRTMKDKTEKYGRMLADIFDASMTCLNDQMVQHGVAKYWDGHGERPV